MKTKLFQIALLFMAINLHAQTTVCFSNPDGIDGSGWSYKDYVIPSGFKLDSVFMDATRPGYPANQNAMVMWYCPSSNSYTNCTGGKATLNYSNFTTSMYNVWLRVDTANNISPGMVRASIPTGAGAIWNQVCFAISPIIVPVCFSNPDGIDGSGWSYKDYVLPSGFKLDSVFMDATRPGYPANQNAMVMWYCPSSNSYTNCTGGKATLNYSNFTTSMYNIWLRVDTANNISPGMVRASLPTGAGAIWNNVCFATSPQISTGINVFEKDKGVLLYPNPTSNNIILKNLEGAVDIDIYNSLGEIVRVFKKVENSFNVSDLEKGFYITKVTDSKFKVKTLSFVKE